MLVNDETASVSNPIKSFLWFLLTKQAFNSEIRASQPRNGYADQTSNDSECGSKPPPYVQGP